MQTWLPVFVRTMTVARVLDLSARISYLGARVSDPGARVLYPGARVFCPSARVSVSRLPVFCLVAP